MKPWLALALVALVVPLLTPVGRASPAGSVDATFEAFRRHARDPALQAEIQALARTALVEAVGGGEVSSGGRVRQSLLRRSAGVFVTLVDHGQVRGCMGALEPVEATVASDVVRATILAATEDHRHAPVRPSEISRLAILVSIVGPRRQVESLGALAPMRLGLLVQGGGRAAVLLPGEALSPGFQVAECRRKAGLPSSAPVLMHVFPTVVFGPLRGGRT